MKKEIEALLKNDGATLKLNDIFDLRREICRDEITNRDIDNLYLRCRLPGFPSIWTERIAAREYAELIPEVESAMRRMMGQATDQLATRFRAGKL